MCGNKQKDMIHFQLSDAETILTWYARLFNTNRFQNKCKSQLPRLKEKVKKLELERKQLVSPFHKRIGIGGAYSSEFAQLIV